MLTVNNRRKVVDLGDIDPLDAAKSGESISHTVRHILRRVSVMLGGDHAVTFRPYGVARCHSGQEIERQDRHIYLDAHFDLGDDNPIYGRLNNATLVRRIMELDGVAPSNISMVGLRGIARKSQVDLTVNSGMNYYPMPVIRQRGLETVMREAIERAKATAATRSTPLMISM